MRRRRGRLSRGSGMRGEKLLQELKSLKELDIELETSEDKVLVLTRTMSHPERRASRRDNAREI